MGKLIKRNNRTLCLLFQVHQPFRLKTYRFFNIGKDHTYYNESINVSILRSIAHNCYLPANAVLLELIQKHGEAFKVTFSISGTALEQFRKYAPEVLDSFKQLYKTGNVEFVAEPYAHSLAMLMDPSEYLRQVKKHQKALHCLFNCHPTALINANLMYSNKIAGLASEMGFKTVLTEGHDEVMGWKSPNYIYASEPYPELKLMLRNSRLSEDISLRFSKHDWNEWPLTPQKFMSWLNAIDKSEELVNLFMDYGTLGEYHNVKTGIFKFFNSFVENVVSLGKWSFRTVTETTEIIEPIALLNVPHTISSENDEHDLTAWLGNELQQEAFSGLYSVAPVMKDCNDKGLIGDWSKLQTIDHFYYMSLKHFAKYGINQLYSPYSSPYDAFVNYMNVLADFLIRVKEYGNMKAYSARPE